MTWAWLGWAGLACTSADTSPRDGGAEAGKDALASDVRSQDGNLSDGRAPGDGQGDVATDGGVPELVELAVTGADGSAAITLVPPFRSTAYDYYVRCAAGTNELTVSMKASPGATSLLVQPSPSRSAPSQTLTLPVAEGQAVVASATDGISTTSYWVRCLPSDFPLIQMNTHPDAGTPKPGYYLVGDFSPSNQKPYAMVLNGDGVPVWYGPGQASSSGVASNVDTAIDGAITFSPNDTSFEVFHLDPLSISNTGPAGLQQPIFEGHDLRVLPSGDFLILADILTSGIDLTGVSIREMDGSTAVFGKDSTIQNCSLIEFNPETGVIDWQWNATDHLDPLNDTTIWQLAYKVTGPDGGPVADPFHCNSVDVDPVSGNYLVSARDLDSVFFVDRKTTGNPILWKLGGLNYTKDVTTFVKVQSPFFRQHDARLQPGWAADCNGGAGQISVFDDESYMDASARGVVYNVNVGAGGGCPGGPPDGGAPGTVAWQYKGSQSSDGLGSFRITADGSRVIGWGQQKPTKFAFSEVDIDGHDLVDFQFNDGNYSYRAIKVPTSALDLDAMRRYAGLQ